MAQSTEQAQFDAWYAEANAEAERFCGMPFSSLPDIDFWEYFRVYPNSPVEAARDMVNEILEDSFGLPTNWLD